MTVLLITSTTFRPALSSVMMRFSSGSALMRRISTLMKGYFSSKRFAIAWLSLILRGPYKTTVPSRLAPSITPAAPPPDCATACETNVNTAARTTKRPRLRLNFIFPPNDPPSSLLLASCPSPFALIEPLLLAQDILGRAIAQCGGCGRGRVAGHGWKNRCANDEQIGHIVGLTIFVDNGVFRIGAHARAAGPAVGSGLAFSPNFIGACGAHDFLADSGHELLQTMLVLVKIKSDPGQRYAPAISMARIQIDTVCFVGQGFGLHV